MEAIILHSRKAVKRFEAAKARELPKTEEEYKAAVMRGLKTNRAISESHRSRRGPR